MLFLISHTNRFLDLALSPGHLIQTIPDPMPVPASVPIPKSSVASVYWTYTGSIHWGTLMTYWHTLTRYTGSLVYTLGKKGMHSPHCRHTVWLLSNILVFTQTYAIYAKYANLRKLRDLGKIRKLRYFHKTRESRNLRKLRNFHKTRKSRNLRKLRYLRGIHKKVPTTLIWSRWTLEQAHVLTKSSYIITEEQSIPDLPDT